MIAGALFFYRLFARYSAKPAIIPVEPVVSWVPTILLGALIIGLAAISFVFEGFSIISGYLCIVLGLAGLLWYVLVRKEPVSRAVKLVRNLDWETIIFLVGIFVVLGAVSDTGLLEDLSIALESLIGGNVLLGFLVIVGVSVLLSGFIDNVPYIIIMLPVAMNLATDSGLPKELYMFGLLIGSCLGGNLTPFGASANVIAVGLLRKEGYKPTFGSWLRIALPFTLLTTTVAASVVWFVWR